MNADVFQIMGMLTFVWVIQFTSGAYELATTTEIGLLLLFPALASRLVIV